MTNDIIDAVEGLYCIIELHNFRNTPGVSFDIVPMKQIEGVKSIDRVIHTGNALSPGPVGDVERPWYMHTHQADNLMVLHGTRVVELYTPAHGKIEKFIVTPQEIRQDDSKVWNSPAMLVWPTGVFHRIESLDKGSASINFAVHSKGFDIKTNFNIYDVDTETGKSRVIRDGYLDQK